MKTKSILAVVGIVLVVGIALAVTRGGSSRVAKNDDVYCSPDGTLTDDMPIQSHRSYCVKPQEHGTYPVGTPSVYAFSIVDDRGSTLKDFATVHEKIMHVIVVRKDLAEFQHVHPEFDAASGLFTLPALVLPSDGLYRVFADFTPSGSQLGVTQYEDIKAGQQGRYRPMKLVQDGRTKTFAGYSVTLAASPEPVAAGTETTLSYSIARDGKSVTNLQNYLGALGHTVVLSEGDLQFIHGHPEAGLRQNGTVDFKVHLPENGTYKVFMQFLHEDNLVTTDYVLKATGSDGMNQGGMQH